MDAKFSIALFLLAACVNAAAAPSQNDFRNDLRVVNLDDARCKKEVAQYIDALQFVRQSAGDMVSTKVMNNYVGVEQLTQVVSRSGYCAGATMLREKGANR